MKIYFLMLASIFTLSLNGFSNNEEAIKQSINKIAQELESKYSGRTKAKVAILQFRTNDNKLTAFNSYIVDELNMIFKSSSRFEVIDQNAMNKVVEGFKWSLEMSNDFRHYSDLSEQIFRNIGLVPELFIYGQINDRDQTITLTGYLVPNGLKSTNLYSTQIIESSEITDKLLGKPIRKSQPKPQPQPQVVVVEKPVIVEKQVIVEKPVYIEKEVVVEKPVYIEKPAAQPQPQQGEFTGKIGNMEFKLIVAKAMGDRVEVEMSVVNNVEDDKIRYFESRFIDPNGNEFESSVGGSTFRTRDLIEKVPIKGTITFRGNDIEKTQSMAVIEINVYGSSTGKLLGTLRFRNVPVKR